MTYEALQKIALSFEDQLEQAARYYAIGDKYVANVEVCGIRERNGKASLAVQLHLLEIFPADADMTDGFEECDLHDLPPTAIVKFAEIKGMVDAWTAGTMPDLPPSTAARLAHRRHPMRVHRRRV